MHAFLRHRVLVGAVVVGLVGVAAGGVAYADIPEGSGVIHGCYANKGGGLRVIDTDVGQSCDAKKETPLRRAVNCRQIEIVRLLVRHGADTRAADRRGVTPLEVARTAEMKQALADAGA